MDNSNQISEETKKEIYKKIVDIMLVSLEKGALSHDDSEEASIFILDKLDKATDEFYLEAALEEFVKRWPAFSPLLVPIREEQSIQQDQKAIANVTNEIKTFTQ